MAVKKNRFVEQARLMLQSLPFVHEEGVFALKGGNRQRARYDMAILKPEFIQRYDYDTISCRDIKKINSAKTKKNLFAVIEFKYIIRHSKSCIKETQFDNLKLQHADEAEHKYFLIFTNTLRNKIKYLEEINLHPSKKAAYVSRDKGKLDLKKIPGEWL